MKWEEIRRPTDGWIICNMNITKETCEIFE